MTKNTDIATVLEKVLGTTFTLYMNTHAYHWNVEGPHFHALHGMFEEQYTDMWNALDMIAERMRALDVYAPYNASQLAEKSTITAATKQISDMDMVKDLADGHEKLSALLSESIEIVSEMGDESTTDVLVERQRVHDQFAWMLRATAK